MKNNHIKSERMWNVCLTYVYRMFYVISILFTIGIGQSWANTTYKFNNGQYIYFKIAGGNTYWTQATYVPKFNWYWDSGSYNTDALGTAVPGTSSAYYYAIVPNAYTGYIQICRMNASNTGQQWNYSSNFEATSDRTRNCLYSGSDCWDNCSLSITTYAPPAKSVALSYNVVPSSGSGTELDPYIVPTGTTVRVTAAGTSELDDPDITKKYKWDSGSYGTTAYKDLACSTNNTTYSTTVSYKNYISSTASTNDKSATVYFKAVSTPTLSLSAPSTGVRGNSITLTATPSNASTPTIVYEYSTSSTFASSVTTIASTTSTTQSWTIPSGTSETTYYLRAKMTISSTTYYSSILTLSAYGKKTIHVKNTNGWSSLYLYAWDSSSNLLNGDWPGTSGAGSNGLSCTNTGGQWWDVVITSQVSGFVLNANVSGDANQTADLSYDTYTDDRCLAIGTGSGKRTLPNDAVSCPTAPTSVTTTAAPTSSTNAKMTVAGSIGTNGNDNITDYGFYYGTTSTPGTKAQVGTSDKTGSISKEITGLTAGTTYYFRTYATNGQGTTYGTTRSYKLPYKVTVSTNTGCSSITNSGTNYTNSTIEVTATKTTGYTFSSWSTTNGTQTSTSSTSTTNTLTFTPTSDNATISPTYTENSYSTTIVATNGSSPTSPQTIKQVTGTSLTATANTNYVFAGWSYTGGGIALKSPSTSTSNPATFTATSTGGTITANFADVWNVKGSGTELGAWETYNGMPYAGVANTFSKTFTLPAKTTYNFKIVKRAAPGGSDVWYGVDGGKTLTRASNSVTGLEAAGGGSEYITFTTDVAGDYTITYLYNASVGSMKITVGYPTAYTVTYGVGTLNGSSSAISVSPSFTSGDYVLPETDLTFSKGSTNAGYTWKGWYSNVAGTGDAWSTSDASLSLTATRTGNISVYACYNYATYTATLSTTDRTGYGSGAPANQTATYLQAMPTITPPTATNGYCFMGYWDDEEGTGTQYYNANGTSAHAWDKTSGATLYAYYKKAEITSLVLTPNTQAPGESVTATPTIYPTPVGDKMLCWKLLRANGNPMDPQPAEWAPGEGNAVSFDAPATSGSYKVACILRTGSSCSGGTVLDSVVADLVVAGAHTVTIQYQDGSGRTLAASAETIGRPLEWSDEIEPATITGYTFARWDAGDGVYLTDDNGTTTKTTTTTAAIKIKATYDGTLTAVYTKKRMIYFYNTLNWENVYVYFYKNNSYWGAASQGTGANTGWKFDSYPYSEGKHGQMLPMEEGSKIYYFDAEAAGVNASYTNVAFTELEQHGCDYFWNGNKVARRSDYKSGSLPLFVPLADQTGTSMNGGAAMYYNDGYWMNYPDNTGYTLKIYDSQDATTPIRTLRFPFSEDTKMPLKLDVEFNSPGTTFYYTIYREDGDVLSADYGMNQNYHSDVPLTDSSKKIRITTTATGIYTYTLVYKDSPSKNYFISVDYPIGQDDYRVWYSDNATWSQGSAHSGSWHHASDVIRKNTDAEVTKYDTVSFYVSKGNDITVTMKFQYASAIAEGGTITWTDVTSGGIGAADTISNAGVYNFIIKQVGTANPVVEKVEKYSGNYYIRTDNAGSTKWDYYRAADHQLTYSEFSKSRSTNTFGELYTHYYMHWCPRSTNIKFCIANDYSPCISDTLESDLTDWGNLSEGAWLKSDGANPDYKDKYSANIRFMYNESTNKISRAYLSSSTNTDRKFLILRSNTKFWNGDGTDLSGTGETSDDENHVYEAIFQDNEDWIYEREIKLTPSSKFKLYASYAQAISSENGSQYFRGAYADNNWSNSDNYVLLIGGEGSPCKARIIYDFKTNRLLAAYLPDNSEIEGTLDIDADLMIIREHQEAGQQITFKTNASQLTDVKTVYGVMRFNRWTLNNRANPEDHDKDHSRAATINTYHPLLGLGSQKSMYERALYWISFPFDVNLSDVFGFGTYGVHWIMMDYNGAERARIGYWKDNDEGFWEYIEDRRGVTLKAGRGYVLALELELMQATDTINFWYNQIQQVELFFPSTSSTTGTISQTDVNVTVDSHLCTIDRRTDKTVDDWNNDRRIADSHWNIIGVPSYANYGSTLTDAGGTVNWQTYSKTANLPFLYEWNANDNTYTAQSGSRYNFKAMHAYYVQYAGTLHWTLASATPSSIVARRTYAEEPENIEFRLELQQNDKMIDQTFVKMSNDEEVSANFAFGEDMDKEFNAGKANVYTFIEGYIPTAGNTLPMSDETTIVPVGVKITSAGEYTFAIPEGTEGIGVTLIDNVANTRTNLSALDYTVNLTAGTHDGRFLLEISPIHNAPTDIEAVTGDGLPANGARKVLIDGILYIVKGDKLYDVRGTMIK